jgi:glycosyltransferase involved in cell wall biosynthesis
LVDVSVIHRDDACTGIQRVVRALLLQLIQSPPEDFVVCPVYATRHHAYRHASADFLNEEPSKNLLLLKEGALTVAEGDIFLGLDLAAHLLPRHAQQILEWKRAGVKVHVLVYDLLPLQHPQWFNGRTTRNFRRWIKWLATYADSAVCISEAVRADLTDWLHKNFSLAYTALPTSRIGLGADISNSSPSQGVPIEAEFTLARLRTNPSLLMVGTLEPRKGHDQVLDAFDELQRRSAQAPSKPNPLLIFVGQAGWKTEALQQKIRMHPLAGKQLIWFEKASDELLVKLYNACSAVVVASLAEGFGLPLIEGALHGKPIIARDLPVFRELNLPEVTYFQGESPSALADAMVSTLATTTTKPSLQAVAYSWASAADDLKNALVLQNAVDKRRLA